MRSFAHQRVRPREVEDPPRLGEGEILRDHHLDNPDVEVRGGVVVFRSRWLPSPGRRPIQTPTVTILPSTGGSAGADLDAPASSRYQAIASFASLTASSSLFASIRIGSPGPVAGGGGGARP